MMSDDEAKKLGQLVSKVDKHVAGCLTVGYAIMIFAQLIKGNLRLKKNKNLNPDSVEIFRGLENIFLANEFIMQKLRAKIDDATFKFGLDCLIECENILKMSGKEDEKSQEMIDDARATYQKLGIE